MAGVETVTLLESEIPAHTHLVGAQNTPLGGVPTPAGNRLNRPASGNLYNVAGPAAVAMAPEEVAPAETSRLCRCQLG